MTFVVAIDGPAGTGKSSVARHVAKVMNFIYVDTGAIYRALAFLAEKYHSDAHDIEALVALIPKIAIHIDKTTHRTRIAIDGVIVDHELRTENISKLSSMVSQHQEVREALLSPQRELLDEIADGSIFEGRDIGTVVFPYAPLKIFITANSETRARRRYEELKILHPNTSYEEVLQAIQNRDKRDESRATAPTQLAADAHVIDTSFMSLEEVTKEALALIHDAQMKPQEGKKLW